MSNKTSSRGVNVTTSGVHQGPRARTQDTRSAAKAGRTRPAPLLDTTPCFGKHELFDSTNPVHHREARELCATCPVIAACQQNLVAVRKAAYSGGQPEGTWAGQLLGTPNPRWHPTVPTMKPARVRAAHVAYNRGERDQWVLDGERQYQRERSRRRRTNKEEVA